MSKTSERRRLAILTAAYEEFTIKGMDGASMTDIAHRAGIGKSTIYEYFSSKTDLIAQACSLCMEHMQTEAMAAFAKEDSIQNRVEGYCQVIWRYIDIIRTIGPGTVITSQELLHMIEVRAKSFDIELKATMQTLLEQGQQTGEIAPDVDLETIVLLLINLPSPRMAVALQDAALQNGTHRLVESIFRGLRP